MESVAYVTNDDCDDGYHAAKDLIRSNDDFTSLPECNFLLFGGYVDTLPTSSMRYGSLTHPGWFGLSLEPRLHYFSGVAPSYTASDIAKGPIYFLLEFGTLTLTLISRCAPSVDGLLFSAAAIVKHYDTWLISRTSILSSGSTLCTPVYTSTQL